jgi:hypothetical protein
MVLPPSCRRNSIIVSWGIEELNHTAFSGYILCAEVSGKRKRFMVTVDGVLPKVTEVKSTQTELDEKVILYKFQLKFFFLNNNNLFILRLNAAQKVHKQQVSFFSVVAVSN